MNDTSQFGSIYILKANNSGKTLRKTVCCYWSILRSKPHASTLCHVYLHIISICYSFVKSVTQHIDRNCFAFILNYVDDGGMLNNRHLNLLHVKLFILTSFHFSFRGIFGSVFLRFFFVFQNLWVICFVLIVFTIFGVCDVVSDARWCDAALPFPVTAAAAAVTLADNTTYNHSSLNRNTRDVNISLSNGRKKWISLCLFHLFMIFLRFFLISRHKCLIKMRGEMKHIFFLLHPLRNACIVWLEHALKTIDFHFQQMLGTNVGRLFKLLLAFFAFEYRLIASNCFNIYCSPINQTKQIQLEKTYTSIESSFSNSMFIASFRNLLIYNYPSHTAVTYKFTEHKH